MANHGQTFGLTLALNTDSGICLGLRLSAILCHAGQMVEVKGSYDQWKSVRKLEHAGHDTSWAITAYLPPGVYQACTPSPSLFITAQSLAY